MTSWQEKVHVYRRSQREAWGPRPQREWKKICTTILAVQKGQICENVKILCLVTVNVSV